MWLAAGLTVHLLFSVPFLGNVDLHKLFHREHVKPAAADSLPTPWKPAPTLALENDFVFTELPPIGSSTTPGASTGPAFRLNADPRELHVAVEADSGTIASSATLGDIGLGNDVEVPMAAYSNRLTEENFTRAWRARSQERINSLGVNTPTNGSQGYGGISIPLPFALPNALRRVTGGGGPAINVRGSEQIQISGTSNWTNQQIGPLGQKRSLFPTLDMQQNLDIQLEGQLSDRIRVNLLQNSATQIPLSNRIAINYRGDEDALFQEVDLGNTNLSLPGTQYVSYSGKNEGLFGVKATSRFGPLDFTILASKQEGRSERASYGGGASKQTQTIRDLEYVKGVYFFLANPSDAHVDPADGNIYLGYDIPEASIRVYRDDFNSTNDVISNQIHALALAEPQPPPPPASPMRFDSLVAIATGPDSTRLGHGSVAVRGQFDPLNAGPDKDYEILNDIYGTQFKVLRLTQPLTGSQRLAVLYKRRPIGHGGVGYGDYETVGGQVLIQSNGAGGLDTSTVVKLLRVPPDLIGSSNADPAVFDTARAIYPVRELELKNFYQLAGQRIDPTTLKITIRQGQDVPPKTTVIVNSLPVPYLQALGLDNLKEDTGTPIKGHDQKIDGTLVSSTFRSFVDFENGTLFLPDPRPFAPRLNGERAVAFDQYIDSFLNRFMRLQGDPNQGAQKDSMSNRLIYDKYLLQADTDPQYYFDVEFNAARAAGQINVGRGNLLEGSEVVTVNGQTLQRGRDYDIDYDLGQITMRRNLGPTDQLSIDYSYAPLFQQAGRTLLGSAFTAQGRDKSLGGAFLYESRGAQDLRPRIGEEPSRSLIGDLNTDWTFHPDWMTRAIDMLPGIRTTAPSDFRLSAEVGASFPNPNTRNEVYIDDMEGVRDALSLSMDQGHWRWSSVPRHDPASNQNLEQEGLVKDAEIHWYSPYAVVKEQDLKPTLSQAEGGTNNRQVLALSVPKRPTGLDPTKPLWVGLTYPVDPAGVDLSKSQFIELWVNDFNDHHSPQFPEPRIRGNHVKLHIDIGKVSEDQMRAPNRPPDGKLDTEDKRRDGQLTVADDVGIDGVSDDDEKSLHNAGQLEIADVTTAGPDDPEGDDFQKPDEGFSQEIDARRYRFTNGTEGDKNLYPYPETEDLNNNGILDTDEAYFEYTIDLGDTNFVETDLQELKAEALAGTPGVDPKYKDVSEDNGWRRYRIAIADSTQRKQFGGTGSVTNLLGSTKQVRIWLEGLGLPDMPADSTTITVDKKDHPVERPLLELGSIDIVGSRWRTEALDTTEPGATVTLNSVNSQDNADIYRAPFDPGQALNGNQQLTRREQSLALEFTHLSTGHSVEAFRTFSVDENYSRYGKLDWFITGFDIRDSLQAITSPGSRLSYFVRFASDEQGQNYYEYRAPVPVASTSHGLAWTEVRLALTELSNLKLKQGWNPTKGDTAQARTPGSPDSLLVHGQPSFTRLRRISFGLLNQRDVGYFDSGQLWFDELRATEVAKDRGHAQRVQMQGRMANLLQYQFAWDGRDADFLSVGETRGSGTASNNYNFSGSLDLHRFFEATGIVLPVAFSFSQTTQRPRFSAGDDIVRGAADLDRSETFADNRAWSVAYSRTWSDRAFAPLRYTLGGITANFSSANSHARNPSGVDQSTLLSEAVNYSITPRNLIRIPLPFLKPRLFPLPERFSASWRVDERHENAADRITTARIDTSFVFDPDSMKTDTLVTTGPLFESLVPRATTGGRSGAISLGADSRPFDFLHHHIEEQRNLQLDYKSLGLNVGRVVNWGQTADASWTPRFLPWVKPQLSWSSHFNQNNGPELQPNFDTKDPVLAIRSVANGQQGSVRWELPFGSLAATTAAPAPRDTGHVAPAGPSLWRRVLSRLGNVGGEVAATKSSSYSRISGIPDFFYLFGFSDNPDLDTAHGARTHAEAGNQSNQTYDWRANGRTTIVLPLAMQLQTAGDFESRNATSNGAPRAQDQLKFPDLTIDFGRLSSFTRLDKVLANSRLQSSMDRQVTTDYNNGRSQKSGLTRIVEFRPLLSIGGDLPNGMHLDLRTEHHHSDRELFTLGNSLQQDINTNVDLSLSRTYSAGQKVSFFGKESTVKSSITMQVTGRYERNTGRILDGSSIRSPVNRDRLSVDANGSYGFSSNVNGTATLGFSQDRDKLTDIVHRSLRIELSTRFTL